MSAVVGSVGLMPWRSWPAATSRPAGSPRAVGSGPSCWSPWTWTASSATTGWGGDRWALAAGPRDLPPAGLRRRGHPGAGHPPASGHGAEAHGNHELRGNTTTTWPRRPRPRPWRGWAGSCGQRRPGSPRPLAAPPPNHWRSAGPAGSSPPPNAPPWSSATAAARWLAATDPRPGAKPTTSDTGSTAARSTWRTWPCCAEPTTARSMRAAGSSPASLMAGSLLRRPTENTAPPPDPGDPTNRNPTGRPHDRPAGVSPGAARPTPTTNGLRAGCRPLRGLDLAAWANGVVTLLGQVSTPWSKSSRNAGLANRPAAVWTGKALQHTRGSESRSRTRLLGQVGPDRQRQPSPQQVAAHLYRLPDRSPSTAAVDRDVHGCWVARRWKT